MSRLKVQSFSISLDGYGAGPNQSLQNPMGEGAGGLHQWFRGTRTFQRMLGDASKGSDGPDEDFAARGFDNIGAWICSAPCAARGRTTNGKAGGATSRRTTCPCSC
jgi:hypothetical protein